MCRRPAVTLLEVLVAIFILGLGLLAIMTLFVLGILNMSRALDDERCAQCGISADGLATAQNVRNDDQVVTSVLPAPPAPDVFADPTSVARRADAASPSYPVFVDPLGYNAAVGASQHWVAGTPGILRRRPVSYATTPASILSFFSLLDDLVFDSASPGQAATLAAGTVYRDTRYSWAYLLQRPQTGDRSVVNCSIVVYHQRPLTLSPVLNLQEEVYHNTAYFDVAANVVTLDWSSSGNVPPRVRAGDWVLDATTDYVPRQGGPVFPHAYFYRIVSATDLPNSMTQIEVEKPLRGWEDTDSQWPTDAAGLGYIGTAIVFDSIAAVFDKGP